MSSSDHPQHQTGPSQEGLAPQPVDPRYAAYQHAPPQYAQPVPVPRQPQPAGSVNVLGIVALGLLLLQALSGLFTQLILRQLGGTGIAAAYNLMTLGSVLVLLVVTGLAIGGVLQQRATRYRWAAVGALVSAVLSLIAMLFSYIGSMFAAMLF